MDDWGELKLVQIDSNDFWCLYYELSNDKSGVLCNRTEILEAYKDGNLYGLTVDETKLMYARDAHTDKIFCDNSHYLLPCLCVKENNSAKFIWIHTRARRMGIAKKLIELLQIKYAWKPLPASLDFWKKM
jgi:hypothetical protein